MAVRGHLCKDSSGEGPLDLVGPGVFSDPHAESTGIGRLCRGAGKERARLIYPAVYRGHRVPFSALFKAIGFSSYH